MLRDQIIDICSSELSRLSKTAVIKALLSDAISAGASAKADHRFTFKHRSRCEAKDKLIPAPWRRSLIFRFQLKNKTQYLKALT